MEKTTVTMEIFNSDVLALFFRMKLIFFTTNFKPQIMLIIDLIQLIWAFELFSGGFANMFGKNSSCKAIDSWIAIQFSRRLWPI